jgi:hypothetical protein
MKNKYMIIFEASAVITKKQYDILMKDNRIGWDSNNPVATIWGSPIKIESARLVVR